MKCILSQFFRHPPPTSGFELKEFSVDIWDLLQPFSFVLGSVFSCTPCMADGCGCCAVVGRVDAPRCSVNAAGSRDLLSGLAFTARA